MSRIGVIIQSPPLSLGAKNGWEFWLALSAITNASPLFFVDQAVLHVLSRQIKESSSIGTLFCPNLTLLQALSETSDWWVSARALASLGLALNDLPDWIQLQCCSHSQLQKKLHACCKLVTF